MDRFADILSLDPAQLRQILVGIATVIAAIVGGLVVCYLSFFVVRRKARREGASDVVRILSSDKWRGPVLRLVPALAVVAVLAVFVPAIYQGSVKQVLWLWIIWAITWLAMRGVGAFNEYFVGRLDLAARDNLRARQVATQLRVLERVVTVLIVVVGTACALMLFERIRQFGVSILASAGIVGITLGFAAQRTIGHIFAGIQLAIPQPIRLDDVVIVEGEWGRIEEITLTYVVVRIWDLRRLILPVTYFIEKPFQNWTRVSADILGTVYIHTDYTVPVQRIRDKLAEIVKDRKEWDGKVCGVVVTDATSQTMVVRALVGSPDASLNWDLRCHVREKLIEFLREEFPGSLPRTRVQMEKQE